MAFNNNFPIGYQPMYYPQYQQQMTAPPVQSVQPQQVQNGGYVTVQNEQEAKDYLVANGTSVTFIDTNNRKLYIKTKGFSSLDQPIFKRYSLVEDDDNGDQTIADTLADLPDKEEIEKIKADIKTLKAKVSKLTGKVKDE